MEIILRQPFILFSNYLSDIYFIELESPLKLKNTCHQVQNNLELIQT